MNAPWYLAELKPAPVRNPRVVLTLALLFAAAPCHAEPNPAKNECEASYERAQTSRADGDLLDATEQLVHCAGVSCPNAMQADCSRWLEEVKQATPTVVFRAQRANGADIVGASVSVDGQPDIALNGRAIPVNPGDHELMIRAPGFVARGLQLQFIEGQTLRRELVTLSPLAPVLPGPRQSNQALPEAASPQPAPASGASHRITPLMGVAAGVAVVGGVGFVSFGLKARSGERELVRSSPNASKGDVSDVKRDYWIANLSLGLGLAGLAVGVVQYLIQDTAAQVTQVTSGVQVGLSPRFIQLKGSF